MFPNELTNPAPSNWPVRVNEAFKSQRGVGLYAPNDLTTTGLTQGYFGGWLGATSIADGTVGALASSNTSYIVAHRTTGAVTHATTTTNWDDTSTYGRLFVAVTDGSGITSLRDWRLLTGGIFDQSGTPGAVDASAVTYTPITNADWVETSDPGNVDDALDQLAERLTDVEAAVGNPIEHIAIAVSDETTALTTGTAKVTFRMPYAFTLTDVRASVTTAPTGGTLLTVDINEAGSTILSTKLTFDASEKTTTTAATQRVISDSSLADDAEITIDIDAVGSTIAGAGLKVYLVGART